MQRLRNWQVTARELHLLRCITSTQSVRSTSSNLTSCGTHSYWTQKWRVIPDHLCRLLDLLPLAPPFLLNSLYLILHHVLGETLFEPKKASVLAGGVFDAVLTTVQ